jgi:Putative zinc-finger
MTLEIPRPERRGHGESCLLMQADISAMLDGELDDALVRRVVVHLEICGACREFLDTLRVRARLDLPAPVLGEQDVHRIVEAFEQDDISGDLFTDSGLWGEDLVSEICESGRSEADEFWAERMLTESREKLAEVFFQLGRAYVILAMSPEVVNIYVREPVPISEYRLRGEAILDGTKGARERSDGQDDTGVRGLHSAEELLKLRLDSVRGNLGKGKRLLEVALSLQPFYPGARILLGKIGLQEHDNDEARRQYRIVLRETAGGKGPKDVLTGVPMRTYAMEHLGVLHQMEDEHELARHFFGWVVRSGAPEIHPSFSSSLLNLSWANLLLERHDEVCENLESIYKTFPDKRKEFGRLLGLKVPFQQMVDSDPAIARRLAASCPAWFGVERTGLKHGDRVRFELKFDRTVPASRQDSGAGPAAEPQKLQEKGATRGLEVDTGESSRN